MNNTPTLSEVKKQIEDGIIKIERSDGIIRELKMSPELQKAMKKSVKRYEALQKRIAKSLLKYAIDEIPFGS